MITFCRSYGFEALRCLDIALLLDALFFARFGLTNEDFKFSVACDLLFGEIVVFLDHGIFSETMLYLSVFEIEFSTGLTFDFPLD